MGDLFAHVAQSEDQKIKIEQGGEDKWKEFLSMVIDPAQQALLKRIEFLGMKNQRFCVRATEEDFDLLKKLGVEKVAQQYFNCVGSYSPTFYAG